MYSAYVYGVPLEAYRTLAPSRKVNYVFIKNIVRDKPIVT